MNNIDAESFYKKAKIFGIILISISIAYYLVVFLPGKEKYKREAEDNKIINQEISKEKEDNQKQNISCLSNAEKIKEEIKKHNEKFATSLGIKVLGDIFYSPYIKSCVYVTKEIIPNEGVNFVFRDAITDKVLESTQQDNYDSLIAKYKDANQE